MNSPFEYTPDGECNAAFRGLESRIEALCASGLEADRAFCRELDAGKMLGVLIAQDSAGARHTLFAFSGQIGDGEFHFPGFVEPVFDYLQPDGYFKAHEAEISRQNREIADFENYVLKEIASEYETQKLYAGVEIEEYSRQCAESKLQRAQRRASGECTEKELQALTRQSQYEKAELRRMKKRMEERLAPYAAKLKEVGDRLAAMKEKRRRDSERLQDWLFSNFKVLNAEGESRSLKEIFAETSSLIPPSGSGECCAPKLLQAAYSRGLKPLKIAEYWYGRSKRGEVRVHGHHYPACRGKCRPVLGWMLKGLEISPALDFNTDLTMTVDKLKILFENEWFCVVEKPEGLLSVPGRSAAQSVQNLLEQRYGAEKGVKVVHRLDRDTSGLLIAAFGNEAFSTLQALFSRREVRKRYSAVLEGDYRELGREQRGEIRLPLSPDWLDRPRQRVDFEEGKEALTEYEFMGVRDGRSYVYFYPHTGRTHQLRVHAASEQGLSMPISGDRLYGNPNSQERRMMLHADRIEFTFPLDDKRYLFESHPNKER